MTTFNKVKPSQWTSIKAWSKPLLLLGLGLYLSYNIFVGQLSNYINLRFVWLSYLAAFLFLLIGIIWLIHLLRPKPLLPSLQQRQPISWFAILVVSIPLLLGTLIPSNPLGASAVSGNLSTTASTGTSWSLVDIPSTQRNVLDWLRLIGSSPDLTALEGQEADVIGFVYTESDYDASTFMVVRFTISCCVADASAIGLPVIWADSASLAQGVWVRVQGTMHLGSFQDKEQLMLQASTVEIVEEPENPYLYP